MNRQHVLRVTTMGSNNFPSFILFLNRRYSLLSFRLPQRILILRQFGGSAYHLCCVFVEVADNSTTHNTVILYSAKGSLSHRRRHTSSNGGLTRGKRHQTQTCALARSTVWAKLHLILNINIFTGGYGLHKFLFQ